MRWAGSIVLALSALILGASPSTAVSADPVVTCRSSNPTCWPDAFAFTPTGRIVFVERFTGQIRMFNLATGKQRLWDRVGNVAGGGEKGVLGVAVHPRWKEARRFHWVYVFYTNGTANENRIIRIRHRKDGTRVRELLVRIPAASNHNGGVIHFGPDARLYAVTGDAGNPALAQSMNSRAGKILRMSPGGKAVSGNPFPGSRIFSFGHRNSFGFTFDPQTKVLWQTENGPTCDDEINRVPGGGNYGWGSGSNCPGTSEVGPSPIQPEWSFNNPVIAPTGAAFCRRCGLGVEGRLLLGSFNDGKIRAATLDAERDDITSVSILYSHSRFVLAVERRSNGRVFFSDDRRIYRLEP